MSLENQDSFDNIVWTDKSSVQLKRHCQTMRVKIGKEVPVKVMMHMMVVAFTTILQSTVRGSGRIVLSTNPPFFMQ